MQNNLYHMILYRHICMSVKALKRLRKHTQRIIVITSRRREVCAFCLLLYSSILLEFSRCRSTPIVSHVPKKSNLATETEPLAVFSEFCSPRTEKYSDSGLRLPPLLREVESSSLGSCLSLLLSLGSKGAYTSEHVCAHVPPLLYMASLRITSA